jgi:hypothetical protein
MSHCNTLGKKQDELNAILDDFELKILQYTMIRI